MIIPYQVRELQDLAYQLGLEESREMSRGTLLNVLQPSGHSSRRRENIENIDRTSRRSNRKQKLATDKRLFFTDSDGQSSDQPQINRPPPTLTENSRSDNQATESQSSENLAHLPIMPSLQLIPNLDSDSNPSSPFRSLRGHDTSFMR